MSDASPKEPKAGYCPKHGPFYGSCSECDHLDKCRDVVKTTYIPPATLSSNPVVNLLRHEAAAYEDEHRQETAKYASALFTRAADEIERLRAGLERIEALSKNACTMRGGETCVAMAKAAREVLRGAVETSEPLEPTLVLNDQGKIVAVTLTNEDHSIKRILWQRAELETSATPFRLCAEVNCDREGLYGGDGKYFCKEHADMPAPPPAF